LVRIVRRMPPSRTDELSASKAVLGLVIERPDTAASIRIRIEQGFPDAHWSSTATENNLKSLVRQGCVRVVEEGRKPGMTRYEATQKGIAHFRRWIRGAAEPLVMRDTLQGKLAFSEPEDLGEMVGALRLEKQACELEYMEAHKCVGEARELERLARSMRETSDAVFMGLKAKDRMKLWGMNVKRLDEMIESLESYLERFPVTSAISEAADG
jgi:DNA-binding PadR family transcriptional regulator